MVCGRSNSIADISNLNQLRSLTDLDLYENSICEIKGLSECPSLTSLDLSFNPIRAIRKLNSLGKTLQKLYLIQVTTTISNVIVPSTQMKILWQ